MSTFVNDLPVRVGGAGSAVTSVVGECVCCCEEGIVLDADAGQWAVARIVGLGMFRVLSLFRYIFLSHLLLSPLKSPLDSSGNLNVSLLKTEIKSDLASDATYKAVDAMKKKAIHTAQSYDEFKNFVACAEQKPLDRGEMESLKQQKVRER